MTTDSLGGMRSQRLDRRATIAHRSGVGYSERVRKSGLVGFDDLFRQEYDSIVRAAYLVTGNQASAAEVTQDAFTQAVVHWRKVQRYDKPGAWVRRVAIRRAIKVRQRDGRRTSLMITAARERRHSASQSESSQRLEEALDLLSPKQRAIVVLHYFDGLSVNEAADVVGCRPATASVHLHRARQRLANELGPTTSLVEVNIDV